MTRMFAARQFAASPAPVPLEEVITRSLAYREAYRPMIDPLAVSILSLFAMVHRLHMEEILPFVPPDAFRMPHLAAQIGQLRARLAAADDDWLRAFLQSEAELQEAYSRAIQVLAGPERPDGALRSILQRHKTVLGDRLDEVMAETGRSRLAEAGQVED